MPEADKVMNLQHFGSDPADIRIRINPEIWIRIPDHSRLKLDALAEVCAFWAQFSAKIGLHICIFMLSQPMLHRMCICFCLARRSFCLAVLAGVWLKD